LDKKTFFESRLAGGSAFLHLDARSAGVRVPGAFAEEVHLVLQYGYALKVPIPDLTVSDWGVRATLSFQRTPQLTAVPWSAVYAIHGDDGEGHVWAEDLPDEVRRAIEAGADGAPAPSSAEGGPAVPAAGESAPAAPSKSGAARRHLKLVD
jgi:stringent starvation protein B